MPAIDRALKLVVARAKNVPAAPAEAAFNPFNLGDRNLTVGILKAVIEMEPGYTQDRIGWTEAQKQAELDRQVEDAVSDRWAIMSCRLHTFTKLRPSAAFR